MSVSMFSTLAFTLALLMVLQEGCGLPLSGSYQPHLATAAPPNGPLRPTAAPPNGPLRPTAAPPNGPLRPTAAPPKGPHIRTKRCSCNSWMDKECIYFCHLDIIWVNTPSKILPYGLGSPLSRRRRSAGRCECTSAADTSCSSFCLHSPEKASVRPAAPRVPGDGISNTSSSWLLDLLRSVIRSNLASAKRITSSRRKAPRGSRPQIR